MINLLSNSPQWTFGERKRNKTSSKLREKMANGVQTIRLSFKLEKLIGKSEGFLFSVSEESFPDVSPPRFHS